MYILYHRPAGTNSQGDAALDESKRTGRVHSVHSVLSCRPRTNNPGHHCLYVCIWIEFGGKGHSVQIICTCKLGPQSSQSAGPVRFLIYCLISIFLLASLVAGRRHHIMLVQISRDVPHHTIHRNIKSALASPGRSRVGPALYIFSLLGWGPMVAASML